MSKMFNIVNYLLQKAIESKNWDDTEEEICGTLIEQGFDNDEIDMALAIAQRIKKRLASLQPIIIPKPSNQVFELLELWRLTREARGYLIAMRELGQISEIERQDIVDAALQMDTMEIDLEDVQDLTAQICGCIDQGDNPTNHTIH